MKSFKALFFIVFSSIGLLSIILLSGCNKNEEKSLSMAKTVPSIPIEAQSNYQTTDGSLDIKKYSAIQTSYVDKGGNK